MGVKLAAASGGSIELVPTNTASNFTVTVPAKTGTMAIDGPAFSVYSTNAQSISSGATAKIQLNTEVFDTAAAFDSTTNYRFFPLVAGYYQINGQIALNGGATGVARAMLFKNGAGYAEGNSVPNNTVTGAETTISSVVYFNGSTDYVELYCYLYTGAGALTLQNSSSVNYFSGAMIRSA
jgi:hypothetical protein